MKKIEITSNQFQSILKKAIAVRPRVRLGKNTNEYFVPSSVDGLYRVAFFRGNFGEMFATCECKGYERGFHCYHIAAALLAHSGFVGCGLRPNAPRRSEISENAAGLFADLPAKLSFRGDESVRNLI